MGCGSSKPKPDRPDVGGHDCVKIVPPDIQKQNPQKYIAQKRDHSRTNKPKYKTKIDSRVLAKYDVKALIGRGSFSDVLRVQNKMTKQPFAIKILRLKNASSREVFQSELAALTRIRHQYVIHLYEVFESKDCVYLVMELATGGELFERIKMKGHLHEKESIRILQMVLEGVQYLHENGIAHRDLKPENLLFYHPGQDSKILITDFGFAKTKANPDDNTPYTTWCGTPEYIAPELLCKKPYTKAVDMWAIGVITYVMLSGHLPFSADTPSKLYQQIINAKYSYSRDVWKTLTEGSRTFIDKLLQVDADKRSTVYEARNDKWVTSCTPLVSRKANGNKYSSNMSTSGKSHKSARSGRSGPFRRKNVEDSFSQVSQETANYNKANRKYLETKVGTNPVKRVKDMDDRNVGRLKIERHKSPRVSPIPDSIVSSGITPGITTDRFNLDLSNEHAHTDSLAGEGSSQAVQEEFPSAAATEDSSSFASRIERHPIESHADATYLVRPESPSALELQQLKALTSANLRITDPSNVVSRRNWNALNGSLPTLLDTPGRNIETRDWINGGFNARGMGQLDMLFSPLHRNNLKHHGQQDTSVMDRVGMWLEDQSMYYNDGKSKPVAVNERDDSTDSDNSSDVKQSYSNEYWNEKPKRRPATLPAVIDTADTLSLSSLRYLPKTKLIEPHPSDVSSARPISAEKTNGHTTFVRSGNDKLDVPKLNKALPRAWQNRAHAYGLDVYRLRSHEVVSVSGWDENP